MSLHRPHLPHRSVTIGLLPPAYQPSPLPSRHPFTGHAATVSSFYSALARGDVPAAVDVLGEHVTWHET
jgi:hypothetical protein